MIFLINIFTAIIVYASQPPAPNSLQERQGPLKEKIFWNQHTSLQKQNDFFIQSGITNQLYLQETLTKYFKRENTLLFNPIVINRGLQITQQNYGNWEYIAPQVTWPTTPQSSILAPIEAQTEEFQPIILADNKVEKLFITHNIQSSRLHGWEIQLQPLTCYAWYEGQVKAYLTPNKITMQPIIKLESPSWKCTNPINNNSIDWDTLELGNTLLHAQGLRLSLFQDTGVPQEVELSPHRIAFNGPVTTQKIYTQHLVLKVDTTIPATPKWPLIDFNHPDTKQIIFSRNVDTCYFEGNLILSPPPNQSLSIQPKFHVQQLEVKKGSEILFQSIPNHTALKTLLLGSGTNTPGRIRANNIDGVSIKNNLGTTIARFAFVNLDVADNHGNTQRKNFSFVLDGEFLEFIARFPGENFNTFNFGNNSDDNSDYAEWFQVNNNLTEVPTGSIIGQNKNKITLAENQQPIIGIISRKPGHIIGQSKNSIPIAMKGKVLCRVNGSHGDINPGDEISLSTVSGVGCKKNTPGLSVGIAFKKTHFENKNQEKLILIWTRINYSP